VREISGGVYCRAPALPQVGQVAAVSADPMGSRTSHGPQSGQRYTYVATGSSCSWGRAAGQRPGVLRSPVVPVDPASAGGGAGAAPARGSGTPVDAAGTSTGAAWLGSTAGSAGPRSRG
jgi:hypothetical protein